ncbi:hypothetical protein OROGR_002462 [Orobanche gracilis]
MTGDVDHPYVPRDLKLPGYVPGFLSQSIILAVYSISSSLVVSFMWILSGRFHKISKVDRLLMCWWIFTGLTHIILEGYFAFSPEFYKEETPHYLAEGKEYSKGDSRYAGRDAGVVAVEGITSAIGGPACLLAVASAQSTNQLVIGSTHAWGKKIENSLSALRFGDKVAYYPISSDHANEGYTEYAIATKKSYSYILQLAISVGQLYGTAVYFVTAILEGDNFATNAFYYYAYYIMANVWWLIIPTTIVVYCWRKICAAFHVQEQRKTKTG